MTAAKSKNAGRDAVNKMKDDALRIWRKQMASEKHPSSKAELIRLAAEATKK